MTGLKPFLPTESNFSLSLDSNLNHNLSYLESQGSALGPLIFLVLVGDIDKDVSSDTNVKSFADDIPVTRGVTSVADTICLQDDLNKI